MIFFFFGGGGTYTLSNPYEGGLGVHMSGFGLDLITRFAA